MEHVYGMVVRSDAFDTLPACGAYAGFTIRETMIAGETDRQEEEIFEWADERRNKSLV